MNSRFFGIFRLAAVAPLRPNLVVPRPASDSPKRLSTKLGCRLQSAHLRRPSTIAFAPKRTFASNALFFHDRSIRFAVTNT
jgi:hypothetical protein